MINSTNYTSATIGSTDYLGPRNSESLTIGSPFGLLLTITQAQSVDTPTYDYSTDYTNTTIKATAYGNDNVFVDEIGLQNSDTLVLQTGGALLIP